MESAISRVHHDPWNKGVIVGQKTPFKRKEVWAIRVSDSISKSFVNAKAKRRQYRLRPSEADKVHG